jgi:hypothetical protein
MRDAAASDPPHSFHIEFRKQSNAYRLLREQSQASPVVACAQSCWRPPNGKLADASFNATGEEPSADQWARHWRRCIDEASAADVTLMFAQEGERQMGALVEAGACLGAGKRLYLVSPHAWSFQHHPRVRCFASLEQAVAAVVAAA